MPSPIRIPSGYVSPHAIAFANADGRADIVDASKPLPVTSALPTTTALAGIANTTQTVGPFSPVMGRSVILALSGSWSGNVAIQRSTDSGVTKLPITASGAPYGIFTTNCCEGVWDEGEIGAALYLSITLTSGSVNYRMAQ